MRSRLYYGGQFVERFEKTTSDLTQFDLKQGHCKSNISSFLINALALFSVFVFLLFYFLHLHDYRKIPEISPSVYKPLRIQAPQI